MYDERFLVTKLSRPTFVPIAAIRHPCNIAKMTANKHTIVYAEDDFDDLFLVKQAFEKHSHIEVAHATDGRKALQMLEEMLRQKSLPCLVILDVNMPVMNGRETLQAIRNHPQLQKLTVVLFTTSNNPTDVTFAKSHNATYVTKPIDFGELEKIALRFVDQCDYKINDLSLH